MIISPWTQTFRQDVVDWMANPTVTGTIDLSGAQLTLPTGTWTPTITAAAGTFTSVSGSGVYTKIGPVILYNVSITITTVGTASGQMFFTLPFTPSITTGLTLYGRERGVSGKALSGYFSAGSTMGFSNYDNTSPIAAGANPVIGGHFLA